MRRFFHGMIMTLGIATLLVILAGAGGAFWFFKSDDKAKLPDRFILEIDLRDSLPLNSKASAAALLGSHFQLTLDDLLLKLRAAETDPRVAGVIMRIAETGHGAGARPGNHQCDRQTWRGG